MPEPVEQVIDRLRQAGYRITTPRRLVLEHLYAGQATHHHYTCEAITQALNTRGFTLDHVTVYRILQWLKDVNIVAQTDVGKGQDVYSLVGEHRHHHLICLNCQRVVNVPDELLDPLRTTLLTEYGFQARIDHFAIFGLCADCRNGDDSPDDDPA
jgi:Fur family ferric uptake transcriptional regulator